MTAGKGLSSAVLKIRRFRIADAGKTSYLIRKALTESNSKDYPPSTIRFLRRQYSPKGLVESSRKRAMYVAERDGRILGTASLDGNFILGVFVNPRFHNIGIGTKLMEHVEGVARRRGYESANVPAAVTAYNFYKRRGYERAYEKLEENIGKIIVMRKRL